MFVLIWYTVPIATTGIFVPVAFAWALLADGPCRGRRWPFIYMGAVINVRTDTVNGAGLVVQTNEHPKQIIFDVLLLKMPLYSNISGRTVVYWLSNIGVSQPLNHSVMHIVPDFFFHRTVPGLLFSVGSMRYARTIPRSEPSSLPWQTT